MRILLVSHSRKDPNGGASRVYHLLEQGLSARGHTVKVLHYEDLRIPPRRDRLIQRLFLPQAVSRAAEREDLQSYDVIMSSSGMLYPLFRKLQAAPKHPLLVNHLHGLSFFDNQATLNEARRGHMEVSPVFRKITGPLTVKWDAEGSRYADLTVAQNGRDLDFLAENSVKPVMSIPLPVHSEILAACYSAPLPKKRDPMTFLWFGSWVERKGKYYLPKAFEQIVEKHPDARLTIGGAGRPAADLLQAFPSSLKYRITVLPRISLAEQIEVYKQHAIFLFPSLSEGFGFALLEAMAMGLAAVTTDTGVAGDCFHDREQALIVPAASAWHLARAGIELASNPELRCSVVRRGQEMARTFTLDRTIDAYQRAFEQRTSRRTK